MLLKLTSNDSKKFYEDLDVDEVQGEFVEVIQMIYDHQKKEDILVGARDRKHIIDQWLYFRNHLPGFDETKYPVWFRIIKRAAAAPNAQTGTERVNSDYNLAKTKLSCSMKGEIVLTRIRSKCNGPPLSMFNPKPVRKLWLQHGHKYAQKVSDRALVIERIRTHDRKVYRSKIFM